jgi:NADH-quinone oxidoreductase subunit H
MKLLLFLIAEFLHMIAAAFLIVILFLGGWHFWGLTGVDNDVTWLTAIIRIVVLTAKILAVILAFMLVRWSWPRFRFDQLMALAWKVMVPLGLANLVLMAVLVEYQKALASLIGTESMLPLIAISWVVTLAGWIIAGMLAPLSTDNTPRPMAMPFDPESELN